MFHCLLQLLYSPFRYLEFICRDNVDSFTFHFLCSDDSWMIFQNIRNNRLFNRTPLVRQVANLAYRLLVSFSHLTSVPPNWQRHATKASQEFHPLSLYYLRRAIGCLREFASPDFHNFGSRLCITRPRINNSKWPPQNTRDKYRLVLMDVRAPCASLSILLYRYLCDWSLGRFHWQRPCQKITGS